MPLVNYEQTMEHIRIHLDIPTSAELTDISSKYRLPENDETSFKLATTYLYKFNHEVTYISNTDSAGDENKVYFNTGDRKFYIYAIPPQATNTTKIWIDLSTLTDLQLENYEFVDRFEVPLYSLYAGEYRYINSCINSDKTSSNGGDNRRLYLDRRGIFCKYENGEYDYELDSAKHLVGGKFCSI